MSAYVTWDKKNGTVSIALDSLEATHWIERNSPSWPLTVVRGKQVYLELDESGALTMAMLNGTRIDKPHCNALTPIIWDYLPSRHPLRIREREAAA